MSPHLKATLSPSRSRPVQDGKTWGGGLSPLQRGTARAKLARGVEHEPSCGLALGTTNISAGLTPRLALCAKVVPLCEGDNRTAFRGRPSYPPQKFSRVLNVKRRAPLAVVIRPKVFELMFTTGFPKF